MGFAAGTAAGVVLGGAVSVAAGVGAAGVALGADFTTCMVLPFSTCSTSLKIRFT